MGEECRRAEESEQRGGIPDTNIDDIMIRIRPDQIRPDPRHKNIPATPVSEARHSWS